MSGRVKRSVVGGLVGAAALGVWLCGVPGVAAASSGQVTGSGAVGELPRGGEDPAEEARGKPDPAWKEAYERADPAWKEAYERVHEPRERSERIEAARESKTGGK
ncbi:hypothetical protein [Streptomyces marispadix]|uniref:Secreted protein n=1 Tax=Streptomyces marispadix TaxID=2922868 RepID=A0ABS9T2Y0_9ACTN|nr:hypothetical protein [Streptomyces marispadix]MCH6162884.1 hypothetical protein [Streptomyces marispadix]